MQGDLISKSELLESLNDWIDENTDIKTILRWIEEFDTAYSVEKVVEALEELSLSYELNCHKMIRENKCHESEDCGMCAFKQAIEVVRNGGKE